MLAEQGLFKLVKYTLAMYSAKAAISILRTELLPRTKNERSISKTSTSLTLYLLLLIVSCLTSTSVLQTISLTMQLSKQSLLPMVATMTYLMKRIPTKVCVLPSRWYLRTKTCEDGGVSYNP